MSRASRLGAVLALGLSLTACNQTGGGSAALGVASALDPTGLSGAAADVAQDAAAAAGGADVDFADIAPRLTDIAAGRTAGVNQMAAFDRQAAVVMGKESAKMARSAGFAAVDAALTGGMSLPGSGYSLAMQGAGSAMVAAQLASARSQASVGIAEAEAQQKARQLVPDEDRPAEARAVLAILGGSSGGSAAWQNPATGASGRVTLDSSDRKMFGGLDCRSFRREWRKGGTVRRGDMLACRNKGEWYALS